MLAQLALLGFLVCGDDDRTIDVSDWLHLEPGTQLVFEGHSAMDYQTKGQPGFVEKFTFTVTWWLADQDDQGRVRAMRMIRGTRNARGEPETFGVEFFAIDPKTLAVTDEPRAGTRFGTSGPTPTKTPFPDLALSQLEEDHSWVEPRPLGGKPTDHQVTVTHPDRADGLDVASVAIEISGPLPLTCQESFGPIHYDAWTNEFTVDLGSGHVLAHKSRFDVRFNDVTQKTSLDMTLTAWDALDASAIATEVACLRKVDALLGQDPATAGELARAFVGEHADSPRRLAGEYFVERAKLYADSAKADQEETAKLAAMVGKPAPDFTLEDLKGNQVSLSALRGKVVLLSFWGVG